MTRAFILKTRNLALLCLVLCLVGACTREEPVRIGFLGGLSGKVADLGVAGRNGAMLAVEQKNAAGGIGGRAVELVVRDDEQNAETVTKAAAELVGMNLPAIIGPMTSSMAMKAVEAVNSTGTILVSPTVTTKSLTGLDDNFLRVIADTTPYSAKTAARVLAMGLRKGVCIYDVSNAAYTGSWLEDFRKTFEAGGGQIVKAASFTSTAGVSFTVLVKELLAAQPEFFLIITNAVDSATICQQIRKQNSKVQVVMAEWASTERFIELAGSSGEGALVSQFVDRRDTSTRYLAFTRAYVDRFGQEPGFAGLAGYDAAQVVLEGIERKKPDETLKKAILAQKTFHGAQGDISLDSTGDADRKTYLTRIEGSRYLTIE